MIATIHGDGADYVRGLGADEVIDTTSEEFQAQDFVNFTRRGDAVIDTVGGKTQDQLYSLVKPGGIIVSAVVRPDTQRAAECRVRSDYLIVDVNSLQLTRLADMLKKKDKCRQCAAACRRSACPRDTRWPPASPRKDRARH